MRKLLKKLSYTQIIVLSFLLVIVVGTTLLCLPVSSANGAFTPPVNAMFTATSATCVTGLIDYDTFTQWSIFGQAVILLLIQIGGLGFLLFVSMFSVFLKKKIGAYERRLLMQAQGNLKLGGSVLLLTRIVKGTFLFEGIGALILALRFCPKMGLGQGLFCAVFHSVSAFCNAGFDLMGSTTGEFTSLTGFVGSGYINLIIMLLIVIGGLGFFVWHDVGINKGKFRKLNLQSKMVLTISAGLIVIGALALFVLEYNSPAFADLNFSEKLWAALFQSVTARTAGFNTVDLSAMSEPGKFVMICLMYIGGSTGSTAGGMKTTTFWILCLSIFTVFFRKKNVEAFGRRMEENITRTASCVFMIYILGTTVSAVVVSAVEGVPMITALFETVSAMATVGCSFGLTPGVSMFTKLLLAFLMICGRVGSVTMLMAFSSEKKVASSRLPLDKVQVG